MYYAYNSSVQAVQKHEILETEFPEILSNDNYADLQTLKRTRVLLIEDDRTTRRMVSKAIGDYCEVMEAFTAGSGVAKFQNFDPDIVFLDLELPDDNGHNTLKWIMYNDPGAHVVLFSGNCDRHNVSKAIDNGARGFVPKPFDVNLMMYYICQCPKLH